MTTLHRAPKPTGTLVFLRDHRHHHPRRVGMTIHWGVNEMIDAIAAAELGVDLEALLRDGVIEVWNG